MAHVLESLQVTVELLHFTDHLQKIAKMAIAHAELALGADEAKRFEADVAKCVSGEGDVASRSERLVEIYRGILARINAHLRKESADTHHLGQQLQACIGVDVANADTICVESLSDDAKQKALGLALNIAARYTRVLEVTSIESKLLTHSKEFSEKTKTAYVDAVHELVTLSDSSKASLDAVSKASVRSESALRTANEKIAQLEKAASETSERVAQVVHDMQKLVYKKEDPDRPTWGKIQQQPLVCLERTVQAMKRASEGEGAGGDAPNCADCQALKAKLDDVDKTLVALVTENCKLLDDKKTLLADRERDKDDMNTLTEQMAKLRSENAAEKTKKRSK